MNDLSHLTGLVDKTLTAIEKRFFLKIFDIFAKLYSFYFKVINA